MAGRPELLLWKGAKFQPASHQTIFFVLPLFSCKEQALEIHRALQDRANLPIQHFFGKNVHPAAVVDADDVFP